MKLRSVLFAPRPLRDQLTHTVEERENLDQLGIWDRALNVIGSLPIVDREHGVYWPEKHLVVDTVICGSNPVLNGVLLQACMKRRRSVVLVTTKAEDDWPYQLCDDPAFQCLIERTCGFGRFDRVAGTYNTGFQYQAPERQWGDTFFGSLAKTIAGSGHDDFARIPERFSIAVDPGLIDVGGNSHVLLHISSGDQQSSQPGGDDQTAEKPPEINLPKYPRATKEHASLGRDFDHHIAQFVPELPLVNNTNAAQMLLAKQLLTTSRDDRFNRSHTYVGQSDDQTSAVEFSYHAENIMAFGSAAWASPYPEVAMKRFMDDVIRASRYATDRMEEPQDAKLSPEA